MPACAVRHWEMRAQEHAMMQRAAVKLLLARIGAALSYPVPGTMEWRAGATITGRAVPFPLWESGYLLHSL